MAVAISGAVNKAPPVAADKFGYWDSVSTGLRQLTWAQMLTALAVTFLPLAGGTLTGSLLLDDTTDVAAAPPLAFDGDANTGIGHPGADRLAFITAGVQRAEFTAAGALDLLSGQLVFPSTANTSSNANTLDDYEEGTWTPQPAFGGASVGMTFSTRIARYTKIGNRVLLETYMVFTAKGSSTGAATVTGLPFAESGSGLVNAMQVAVFNATGLTAGMAGYITAGGSEMQLLLPNTTGAANSSDAQFTNTTNLLISGNYTTNA